MSNIEEIEEYDEYHQQFFLVALPFDVLFHGAEVDELSTGRIRSLVLADQTAKRPMS